MNKTCVLTVKVDYDDQQTDPESLAVAMDKLCDNVLSTPGIWDDYGPVEVGDFYTQTLCDGNQHAVRVVANVAYQDTEENPPADIAQSALREAVRNALELVEGNGFCHPWDDQIAIEVQKVENTQ